MSYDSRPDTHEHIETVRSFLGAVIGELQDRAERHDESKLIEPELSKAFLVGMGEGLKHHYEANDHHPEHFEGGIADMDLVQVTEMLCDWKAATMRHADGDLARSIEQNAERYGYGDEMKRLLLNTAIAHGWITRCP